MRKITLVIFLIQITFCAVTKANIISLYSGDLQFEVSDEYAEFSIPKGHNIGYYSKSGNKIIALYSYRKNNFDVSKIFEVMDSCLCDLTKFDLIDSETEYFWNLTTDYVTKKYVSDSGQKFASHTRYVTGGAYCFGFWYTSEEDFKEFEDLIESIHFSEEEGWSQIKLTFRYGLWMIILLIVLLFIATIFAGADGSKGFSESFGISLLFTFIIALVYIIPLWHFWVAYFAILGAFFVICFICAYFGFYLTIDSD